MRQLKLRERDRPSFKPQGVRTIELTSSNEHRTLVGGPSDPEDLGAPPFASEERTSLRRWVLEAEDVLVGGEDRVDRPSPESGRELRVHRVWRLARALTLRWQLGQAQWSSQRGGNVPPISAVPAIGAVSLHGTELSRRRGHGRRRRLGGPLNCGAARDQDGCHGREQYCAPANCSSFPSRVAHHHVDRAPIT